MSFLPKPKKTWPRLQAKRDAEALTDPDNLSDDFEGLGDPGVDEPIGDGLDDDFSDLDMYGGGGVAPLQQHKDLLASLTDFEKMVIKPKMHSWAGDVMDSSTGRWVKGFNKPLMNQRGISWVLSFIESYTHGGNILTHFDHNSFSDTMTDVIEVIWLKLSTSKQEFLINDNEDLLRICVDVEGTIKHILQGAGSGKYKDFLATSTHRTENISNPGQSSMTSGFYPSPAQKKQGFFQGLFKRN